MTIQESVEDYLAECRARGLRATTVTDAYGWPLRRLWLPWCEEHGVQLEDVAQGAINRFAAGLHERRRQNGQPISPRSIQGYGAVVGRWLAWARREGHLQVDARVPRTRVARRVREVITEDEFKRMLAAAGNDRDRLLLSLLWDTGLRASELINLRLDDLVRHDGRWFLRVLAPYRGGGAKGDRERLVPLPRPQELRRFLAGPRARMETTSDRIFLSRRRNADGGYDPITIAGLQQVVVGLARDAGISHRVHPHLFRHSAVTRWLRQDIHPLRIAAIVGHSSLKMIEEHYSQLDHRDAYDALAAVLVKEANGPGR